MDTQRFKQLVKELETKAKYVLLEIPYSSEDIECDYIDDNGLLPCTIDKSSLRIKVDMEQHKAVDWKRKYGTWKLHTMVADKGKYTILDHSNNVICYSVGYVPNEIIPPRESDGDCISFSVDKSGNISGWNDDYDFEKFADNNRIILPEDIVPVNPNMNFYANKTVTLLLFPLMMRTLDAIPSRLFNLEYYIFVKGSQLDLKEKIIRARSLPEFVTATINDNELEEMYSRATSAGFVFEYDGTPMNRLKKQTNFKVIFSINYKEDGYYVPLNDTYYKYDAEMPEYDNWKLSVDISKAVVDMYDNNKSGIKRL